MGNYTEFELRTFLPVTHGKITAEQKLDIDNYLVLHEDTYLDMFEWSDYRDAWHMYEKWYNHDEDMAETSHVFSQVVFQLDGKEDSGDIWRSYWLNGEEQFVEAKIVYEECKW